MVHDQPSLREQIESQLSSLSKKQRLVAEYILANPTTMLFASVAEVAEVSNVDPATVVRLAKRLGYSGFPELRERLRVENLAGLPVEQLVETGNPETQDDRAELYERIRRQTVSNIERTFDQLDPRTVEAAVTHVLAARRVVVVGAGLSRGIALHLARVLQTAQIPIHVVEDWYDLLFDAATISADDVIFAVTAQRYSTVTITALRVAKEAGATTIMLTDATFAPGIRYSDVVLLFSPRSTAEFYSPVGGSAVIDCIAAGLAARVPERVKHALERHVALAIAHELSYW